MAHRCRIYAALWEYRRCIDFASAWRIVASAFVTCDVFYLLVLLLVELFFAWFEHHLVDQAKMVEAVVAAV